MSECDNNAYIIVVSVNMIHDNNADSIYNNSIMGVVYDKDLIVKLVVILISL